MTVMDGKIRYLREEFAQELGRDPVGLQLRYSWEE